MLCPQAWRMQRAAAGLRSKHLRLPLGMRSRPYATIGDISSFPNPGEQVHGFTLKRTKHVPELQLTALNFQHNKTGTDYLHIARDDKNNVFSIGFKTNPPDRTGVPHILEHTTLCGSKLFVPSLLLSRVVLISLGILSEIPSSRCCQGPCRIS